MINLCVWNKSNGGMGSLYRSKHELVGVFKHGKATHTNNVQLGKFGRDRTNVWDYPGVSSFGKDREQALAMHPTVKPVELLKDILLDTSKPHDIVIDGFLGSGSTLMAAEKVHRRCFGVEIDPKYVDVTLWRWMQYTGEEPIHIESGLTFSQLTIKREHATEVA
jgi:DNA modification methylase